MSLDLIEADPLMPRGVRNDDGSWLVPGETADWLEMVLLHYYSLGVLFALHEDRIDARWAIEMSSTVALARAEERVAAADREGWPVWTWLAVIAGVGVVMGLAGLVVGVVAAR